MRRRVLPFSSATVNARDEQILLVPVEEPLSLRFLQLRHAVYFDVLAAGVVTGALLRLHAGNALAVKWTEVDDMRCGPLDELNSCWPLSPRGAQVGDYLAAWVYNADCAQQVVRGHFVVGDPT